jgi:hypothetical protein
MESSKAGEVVAQNKRRNFFDTAGLSADTASLPASPHIDRVVAQKGAEAAGLNLVASGDRIVLVVEISIVVSNQATGSPAARCQTMLD